MKELSILASVILGGGLGGNLGAALEFRAGGEALLRIEPFSFPGCLGAIIGGAVGIVAICFHLSRSRRDRPLHLAEALMLFATSTGLAVAGVSFIVGHLHD